MTCASWISLRLEILLYQVQWDIVIFSTECAGIRNWSIHCPSLAVIFCADEVLNLRIVGNMPFGKLRLPVSICARIAPLDHALHLLVCPCVEVHGFNSRDVCAHASVNAGTPNANEDA
jgi:hypothetical protein